MYVNEELMEPVLRRPPFPYGIQRRKIRFSVTLSKVSAMQNHNDVKRCQVRPQGRGRPKTKKILRKTFQVIK